MKTFYLKIISTFCLLFFVTATIAQPGTLDSGFGVNGNAYYYLSNDSYPTYVSRPGVVLQKDGKIVVAASKYNDYYGLGNTMHVTRFTANGSLDSTFGVNGNADVFFDSLYYLGANVNAVAIQPDEKILIGGSKGNNMAFAGSFALARCLPDGNLDSSFGVSGKVITHVEPFEGVECSIYDIAILPDGKFLAGGFTDGFCLVKYLANGMVDSSFGVAGKLQTAFDNRVIVEIKVLSDSKFLLLIEPGDYAVNAATNIEVCRILPNGIYDSTFAINGRQVFNYAKPDEFSRSTSFLVLYDGSIVVAGSAYNSGTTPYKMILTKLKSNGTYDSSFGINGYINTTLNDAFSYVSKVLLQQDGKFLTVGNLLTRFNPDGSIDSSFGVNGSAANHSQSVNGALQPDQKVVTNSYPLISVARYKNDPPITVNFQKNISITEGNSGTKPVTFKAVLNRPSQIDVQVNYNTIDGTAKSGSDYIAASSTAMIKAGKTVVNIPVSIIGDSIRERNDKFFVALSSPVNANIGVNDTATCTIKNDDFMFASSVQSSDNAAVKTSLVKVYPNPAGNYLQIQGLESNTNISLHDMRGNIVKQAIASGSYKMNISGLAAGVYELVIITKTRIEKIKVAKE